MSSANALKARWKQEKELITRVRQLKERIEQLKLEEQTEERKGNLERVAQIRYGELRQAEAELQKLNAQMDGKGQTRMLKEEVDEEDVARIVSKWTGIPVSKMLEGEVKKLVAMEDRLRQRVIGQDEALERVSNAVRRSRAGLSDPRRPIGSFIFLGPTGVGKTELARALAEFLFDDERAHDPHRHVGVHGEARGGAADRRASGLRRLRRGRTAHRGRSGGVRIRSCCSTRSRRRTRTCSTCCCRSWMTAA